VTDYDQGANGSPLKDGNILASMRSVSAVVIIDKASGDIIWHLDSAIVAQQHNATELPNGNILVSLSELSLGLIRIAFRQRRISSRRIFSIFARTRDRSCDQKGGVGMGRFP
jgi:hypothetical protein